MIVPGVGAKVLIALRPVDFRKGMDGLAALVRETLGAESFWRGDLRFPQQARRSGQAAVLGRHGAGAGGQAIGRGFVPLAELARWRDAADASAIVGAAGGPRLGAGARGENAGAEGGFVITIICGKRLIL